LTLQIGMAMSKSRKKASRDRDRVTRIIQIMGVDVEQLDGERCDAILPRTGVRCTLTAIWATTDDRRYCTRHRPPEAERVGQNTLWHISRGEPCPYCDGTWTGRNLLSGKRERCTCWCHKGLWRRRS
jgi:hypothetical protein